MKSINFSVTGVLSAAILLLVIACSQVAPDEFSLADANRTGAQSIPLNRVVTDTVNFEGGDATDWKVFSVSSSGLYSVEIFWDHPYVQRQVILHNQYGVEIDRLAQLEGEGDLLQVELQEAGDYYLKIHAQRYRSSYSLRVSQGEPQPIGAVEVQQRPEFDRTIE
tara:strand:- start:310 stop:804 length:495 start_codon:yes stop_codon:yes gene_type:complete